MYFQKLIENEFSKTSNIARRKSYENEVLVDIKPTLRVSNTFARCKNTRMYTVFVQTTSQILTIFISYSEILTDYTASNIYLENCKLTRCWKIVQRCEKLIRFPNICLLSFPLVGLHRTLQLCVIPIKLNIKDTMEPNPNQMMQS